MAAVLLSSLLLLSSRLFRPVAAATEGVALYPVLNITAQNWGAPCLIQEPDGFYSFATNNRIGHVPVAFTNDWETWNLVKNGSGQNDYVDAMPDLPSWVAPMDHGLWAPDVNKLNNGSYILYFTAISAANNQHCIGVAYAKNVTGPYTSMSEPWFCPPETGGQAIDPDGFEDPSTGRRYITFKNRQPSSAASAETGGENNSKCKNQGPPWASTPIVLQEVDQDGITRIGDNYTLIDNNGESDVGNTESPSLFRSPKNGNYVLTFSTGCFKDSSYTVSYAVSTSGVTGPYTRHDTPLLQTGEYNLVGPGTMDVLDDGLYSVMFSHQPQKLQPPKGRKMRTALLNVVGEMVAVNGTLPGVNTESSGKGSGSSTTTGSGSSSTSTSTPTSTSTKGNAAPTLVAGSWLFGVAALLSALLVLL